MGIFIVGLSGGKPKDYGPVVLTTCPNCRNETTFHYVKVRKSVSVYFVPVVPYSTKHYLQCPVCSRGMELTREQAQQAYLMVSKTTRFLAQELDPAEYRKAADEFWAVLSPGSEPRAPASPEGSSERLDDGAS